MMPLLLHRPCDAQFSWVICWTFIRFVCYDIFFPIFIVCNCCQFWHSFRIDEIFLYCFHIFSTEFFRTHILMWFICIYFPGISTLIKRLDALNYSTIFYIFDGKNSRDFDGDCDMAERLSSAYHKRIIFWPCPQMKVSLNVSKRAWKKAQSFNQMKWIFFVTTHIKENMIQTYFILS